MKNKTETFLTQATWLQSTRAATRDMLATEGQVLMVERRRVLYVSGQPAQSMFLIGVGRARLARIDAHGEIVLGFASPGDVIGDEGLVSGSTTYTTKASVVEDLEALELPVEMVLRACLKDPELPLALARRSLEQRLAIEQRLSDAVHLSVAQRLAAFLVQAAARWGVPHGLGATLVAAPIPHTDIALMIGSTRETTSVEIGLLRSAGVLGPAEHRRLVILDMKRLKERARA